MSALEQHHHGPGPADITRTPRSANVGVVVVERDPRRRMAIASKLGDVDRSMSRSIARIGTASAGPTVAVFGPSFADDGGLAEIETFLRTHRRVTGVLATYEVSAATLQRAMRAGLVDVVAIPDGMNELGDVVSRAAARISDAHEDVRTDLRRTDRPGKVIVVFGTKGGSGKSFVATNLAVMLARTAGGQVGLIDADLQFGDTAVMLQLSPEHTIADVVASMDPLEPVLSPAFFFRHEASGLLVLPAPAEPALADQIAPRDVTRVVTLARSFCSHVIVDTPGYFTDVVLGLLDKADEILLVAGMDVPNIKNVKLGLNTMRLLDIPDSRIRLVLNRTKSKAKMEVGDVEKVLGRTADACIPSDIVVPRSINEGVPAVLSAPKSEVARSIESLAALVRAPDRRRAAGR